jgi:FkbM family methyltransferase
MGMTTKRRVFQAVWDRIPHRWQSRILQSVLEAAPERDKFRRGVPSMEGLLLNARDSGFAPAGIIDIGANVGDWARTARSVFPDAAIAMFDGNPLHEPQLAAAARAVGRADHTVAVLGPAARDEVKFYSIGTGSGVLPELTSFPREELRLPMSRLDDVITRTVLGTPLPDGLFMKLDVQGFELEVLRGATTTLAHTEFVVMEAALLPYNDGAPTFMDVLDFMRDAGFVPYDFCGQFRRESDWALCQTDIAFARANSPLRRRKPFFASEPTTDH